MVSLDYVLYIVGPSVKQMSFSLCEMFADFGSVSEWHQFICARNRCFNYV